MNKNERIIEDLKADMFNYGSSKENSCNTIVVYNARINTKDEAEKSYSLLVDWCLKLSNANNVEVKGVVDVVYEDGKCFLLKGFENELVNYLNEPYDKRKSLSSYLVHDFSIILSVSNKLDSLSNEEEQELDW